jgi:hypothetical protein
MRTARNILTTIVLLALLCSGMPLTGPEDVNQDNLVDLRDAILCIKDFARTAEEPGAFFFEMETALSVMSSVAELKGTIGPSKDTKAKPASGHPNGFYLIPSTRISHHLEESFPVTGDSLACESLSLEPATPPPKKACIFGMVRFA